VNKVIGISEGIDGKQDDRGPGSDSVRDHGLHFPGLNPYSEELPACIFLRISKRPA
jgi:hypothetical protein